MRNRDAFYKVIFYYHRLCFDKPLPMIVIHGNTFEVPVLHAYRYIIIVQFLQLTVIFVAYFSCVQFKAFLTTHQRQSCQKLIVFERDYAIFYIRN